MTHDPASQDRTNAEPAGQQPAPARQPAFATQQTARKTFGQLSTSMKALIITVPALLVVIATALLVVTLNKPSAADVEAARAETPTVADDTHYLDQAGADAPTVVEFLDFECEVCAMVYPYAEEIRQTYAGKINYAVRYFPLAGHRNSMTAAVAVEAAARQGKFEDMYHKMFATLPEWGEKQDSQADLFRGYAEQVGLDMAAYDAAVADPTTEERVKSDYQAGEKLGVSGTPTFFVDGKLLQISYTSELNDAIDEALAKR